MSLLNLAGFLSSNLGAFMTHLLEVNEAETWIRWVEGCCWWFVEGSFFNGNLPFGGIKVDRNLWGKFEGFPENNIWFGLVI